MRTEQKYQFKSFWLQRCLKDTKTDLLSTDTALKVTQNYITSGPRLWDEKYRPKRVRNG